MTSSIGAARCRPAAPSHRVRSQIRTPQEMVTEQIWLVLPIPPGERDDARAFMLELEQSRKEQYAARRSDRDHERSLVPRHRSTGEHRGRPHRNLGLRALSAFSTSQDDFDPWFKARLAHRTGIGLNPPRIAPELLSNYLRGMPLA
jgi:hypothetical protein